jgi:hypothetical protein
VTGYCTGCGRTAAECAGGCTGALDPPRFCPQCGRRLAVQVFPGHVVTRCPAGTNHVSPA